jgi:membrane-bound lytic murein transglycosylase MltF
MIKRKIHPSLLFGSLFILFWLIFSIFFGINEAGKVAEDFTGIKKDGVLRICGEEDLFSFYSDEEGTHGFHYELVQAFAKKHGLQVIYTSKNNLEDRIKSLQNDECDLLVGPLPITSDLGNILVFTEPLYVSQFVLIQRKNTKIIPHKMVRNLINFGDKDIYTTHNRAIESRLHHLSAEISDTIRIRNWNNADNERLIALVASGLIDYGACDMYVAQSYLKRYPSIDCETAISFNHFEAWAIKPGKTELLDSLNAFISSYKNGLEYAELKSKYNIR